MPLSRRTKIALFALALLCALLPLPVPFSAADDPPPTAKERPKLVVLVVFDQFRGDYLERFRPLFGEGGFKRLMTEGTWFTNAHYPYSYTLTACGHTSLSTGANPARHGIVANDWYDRTDGDVTSVSPPPALIRKGEGPYRRHAQTIGDALLEFLTGRSRVFSLSIKDRAAILMAALRAQCVYWFDYTTGEFVTSPYYREEPHKWVTEFNGKKPADVYLGKTWNKVRTDIDYAKYSSPDDFYGEGIGYGQGQTFPHPFPLGKGTATNPMVNYWSAVENSPMGNDLLLAFAETMIRQEKIGQTDNVDYLSMSFSSNDLVGHCWGPDSQEVMDITLRSDLVMKKLLDLLDTTVGKGKYVIAMSADHGVCPLPEMTAKKGIEAERVPPELLTTLAEDFLNKTFLPAGAEKEPWLLVPRKSNAWVYLSRPTLAALKLDKPKVERALAGWFATQPGIATAYAAADLMAGTPPEKSTETYRKFFENARRSYTPQGVGDVMVILKPYNLFSPPLLSKNPEKIAAYRTTHGTPNEYDTHVPLLVMGAGVRAQVDPQPIAPQSIAAILTGLLRVPAPRQAEYAVPAGFFRD
ncbi:MAG TPA: alkaline phosphatase family protein [Gemmataceae bacterium]|jgi:predicted AlkP superfamily pyrophosphatase or phosphodiesterase|nr:alkaline phosphatase family protein [Gemmataceae bacterium]